MQAKRFGHFDAGFKSQVGNAHPTCLSCNAFKLGISSEQDAKPAAWLRLTHYKDCAIIDIKV
jgi:hypothetical protein